MDERIVHRSLRCCATYKCWYSGWLHASVQSITAILQGRELGHVPPVRAFSVQELDPHYKSREPARSKHVLLLPDLPPLRKLMVLQKITISLQNERSLHCSPTHPHKLISGHRGSLHIRHSWPITDPRLTLNKTKPLYHKQLHQNIPKTEY